MADWLFELNPTRESAFGEESQTWSEIKSWADLTGRTLTILEAKTLKTLSREYAIMFEKAKEGNCPPPWFEDIAIRRKSVSDALRVILDSMIASRSK